MAGARRDLVIRDTALMSLTWVCPQDGAGGLGAASQSLRKYLLSTRSAPGPVRRGGVSSVSRAGRSPAPRGALFQGKRRGPHVCALCRGTWVERNSLPLDAGGGSVPRFPLCCRTSDAAVMLCARSWGTFYVSAPLPVCETNTDPRRLGDRWASHARPGPAHGQRRKW